METTTIGFIGLGLIGGSGLPDPGLQPDKRSAGGRSV